MYVVPHEIADRIGHRNRGARAWLRGGEEGKERGKS
jgi:hypothetical protein